MPDEKRPRARLHDFSEGYYLVENVKCVDYTGDQVVVNDQLFTLMEKATKQPLIKVRDKHYWPDWQLTVPADTIAIPELEDMDERCEVLLAKQSRAKDMLYDGKVTDPYGPS